MAVSEIFNPKPLVRGFERIPEERESIDMRGFREHTAFPKSTKRPLKGGLERVSRVHNHGTTSIREIAISSREIAISNQEIAISNPEIAISHREISSPCKTWDPTTHSGLVPFHGQGQGANSSPKEKVREFEQNSDLFFMKHEHTTLGEKKRSDGSC